MYMKSVWPCPWHPGVLKSIWTQCVNSVSFSCRLYRIQLEFKSNWIWSYTRFGNPWLPGVWSDRLHVHGNFVRGTEKYNILDFLRKSDRKTFSHCFASVSFVCPKMKATFLMMLIGCNSATFAYNLICAYNTAIPLHGVSFHLQYLNCNIACFNPCIDSHPALHLCMQANIWNLSLTLHYSIFSEQRDDSKVGTG